MRTILCKCRALWFGSTPCGGYTLSSQEGQIEKFVNVYCYCPARYALVDKKQDLELKGAYDDRLRDVLGLCERSVRASSC